MNKIKLSALIFGLYFCSLASAESLPQSITLTDNDVMMESPAIAFSAIHGSVGNYSISSSRLMLGKLFPPSMIMRHQEKLGLSAGQVESIKNEMREFQSGVVDIQWDLHAATSALNKETDKPKIDSKRALSLVDRVLAAENKLKKSHLSLLIKIRNVLNEEQLMKMKRMFATPVRAFDISSATGDFIWNEELESF